jgi:tetratricopeptide (TPR) repeat protein
MAMSALPAETPPWQAFWAKAREARESGRINQALTFFGKALAANPLAAEPYAEAADLAVQLERGLAPLAELYARHCAAFDLPLGGMPFRTQNLPIDGKGLHQSLDWLEIAANLDPANPTHLQRRAEILEELGRIQDALACRRHIARHFPAIEANCWALAILLERTGAMSEALSYGEGFLAGRAPIEPVPALCLARVYEYVGRHEDSRLLGKHLTDAVSEAGSTAAAILFRLAWAATNDGLPAESEWPRTLLLRSIEMAKQPEASIEAELAAGFATEILGDQTSSRKYFAAACWKGHKQFGAATSSGITRELQQALHYAARKLLDFATDDRAYDGPPVATRHLLLICADHLRQHGTVIDALARFDEAFGSLSNSFKDDPFETQASNTYRGYRIVASNEHYYAIPDSVLAYKIFLGSAYRIPTKARIAIESCPPRFKQALRNSLTRYGPWKPGTGAASAARDASHQNGRMTPLAMRILNRLLTPFAIRDVLKTTDISALYSEIDVAARKRQQHE